MGKTAVVYYSQSGTTEYIAEQIKESCDAELIKLVPEKAYPDSGFRKFFWDGKSAVMAEAPKLQSYEFDPEAFDTVVIGFPVWAGTIAPPIRTFVREQKEALKGKRILAWACQGGSGAEKALNVLKGLLGIEAFTAEMILNDPKDRPEEGNQNKLQAFINCILEQETQA